MFYNTRKFSYFSLTVFGLLLSLLLLAACGGGAVNVTNTPTKGEPTSTTSSAVTTSTTSSKAPEFLSRVAGATEVQLDSAFSKEVSRLLGGTKNLTTWLYVSSDSAEKLANSFDSAITIKGYTGLSGKPTKSGAAYVGIYGKAGADDLILTTLDSPKDAGQLSQGLNFPGLSQDTVDNIYKQIKGKNAIAFVFSGSDLIKAIFEAANASPTPAVTPRVEITAPPATLTAAATRPTTASTVAATPVTTGLGSELINTLAATKEIDLKVTKIERYEELKYENTTIRPKGVFLVVSYDFANVSKYPVAINSLSLKDGQGREFDTVIESEVSAALINMGYKSSFVVNPGFIGSEYRVYDVPKDAMGLQLVPLFETDRKPSASSFNSNGGKGPDSGAGVELAGKTLTITDDQTDIKILNVQRVNVIKDDKTEYKSSGIFLIVTYEMKNNGSKAVTAPVFRLQDGEGRVFSTSDSFDITYAIAKNSKTKFDDLVDPGQAGINFKVFEVLKESSKFSLIELG